MIYSWFFSWADIGIFHEVYKWSVTPETSFPKTFRFRPLGHVETLFEFLFQKYRIYSLKQSELQKQLHNGTGTTLCF